MGTFTRFLLLNLYLSSHVYANKESTDEAVKWLEAGRSVLVHLGTPDLFYCKLPHLSLTFRRPRIGRLVNHAYGCSVRNRLLFLFEEMLIRGVG